MTTSAFLEEPLWALLVSGSGLLLLLGLISALGDQTDIVVGALEKRRLEVPSGWHFSAGVSLAVVAVALAWASEATSEGDTPRTAPVAYSALAIAALAALPLLFGQFAHPLGYPLVRATDQAGSAAAGRCGLLIGRSNGEIVLWRSDGRFGVVEAVPASRTTLQFGPMRDIRVEALYAAGGKVPRPTCDSLIPSPFASPSTPLPGRVEAPLS